MRKLKELSDFLDSRGLSMSEFIRIVMAVAALAGIVCFLGYGAILALLQ